MSSGIPVTPGDTPPEDSSAVPVRGLLAEVARVIVARLGMGGLAPDASVEFRIGPKGSQGYVVGVAGFPKLLRALANEVERVEPVLAADRPDPLRVETTGQAVQASLVDKLDAGAQLVYALYHVHGEDQLAWLKAAPDPVHKALVRAQSAYGVGRRSPHSQHRCRLPQAVARGQSWRCPCGQNWCAILSSDGLVWLDVVAGGDS